MSCLKPTSTLCLLAGLLAVGCDPPPDSAQLCQTLVTSISAAASAKIYQPMETWDVSSGKAHQALLGYRLPASTPADGVPERGEPALKGFEIRVDMQGIGLTTPQDRLQWWTPVAASPGLGSTGGPAVVLPWWLARDLATVVSASPSVSGWPVAYVIVSAVVSLEGEDVSCAAVVWPVQVCNGCLG